MDGKSLSTNELINALENAGRTPELDLIRTCLARVAELEPALLDLLRTAPEKRYDLDEPDDPRGYSDIHAGNLLIAARAPAALPIFGDIFRDEPREHLIEWFGESLHHYGSAALPVFTELLLDTTAFKYGRSFAAAIIRKIAQLEPEQRTAVTATLHQLLPPADEPLPDEAAYDEMWSWAVLELGKLGDTARLEPIKALFDADLIDTWLIGDYGDYLQFVAEEPKRLPEPYDIIQSYRALHEQAAQEAKAKLRWAKQQAKEEALAAAREKREAREAERATRKVPKVGRNEPCPCGSGLKYKKCHGRPGGGND